MGNVPEHARWGPFHRMRRIQRMLPRILLYALCGGLPAEGPVYRGRRCGETLAGKLAKACPARKDNELFLAEQAGPVD